MGLLDQANRAAILAAGTDPAWDSTGIVAPNGAPSSTGSGLSVAGAVRGWYGATLRREVHRRRADIQVSVYDASQDVVVTIDATAVTTTAATHSTVAELMEQIAADLNGNATVASVITATAVDSEDRDVATDPDATDAIGVRIQGNSEASFSFDATSGGSMVLITVADAESASIRTYLRPGGQAATRPEVWAEYAEHTGLDYRGIYRAIDLYGMAFCYVEVTAVAGDAGDGAGVDARVTTQIGAERAQDL